MSTSPAARPLHYEEHGATCYVTLNRPEKLNALDIELYTELRDAFRRANESDIDTIVVRGSGRAFSTGGDLDRVFDLLTAGGDLQEFLDALPFEEIYRCDKTVVAGVHGPCVAGGLVIACLSDIVIADETASFGFPQGRVGLAETSTPSLLFGRISMTQLKYMVMTGTTVNAATAERIGLVTEVVPAGGLDDRIEAVIAELRSTPAVVRATYKQLIRDLVPYPPHETRTFGDTLEQLRTFTER